MKSQNVYKQNLSNKRENYGFGKDGSISATHMNSEYIRGTQVTKDFQLIAEPILHK
jgi:hypothetical protein